MTGQVMDDNPYVIVVDDEPEVRKLVVRLATRAIPHAKLQTAPTAEAAEALLPGIEADRKVLIISDFNLGDGMNGAEFLKRSCESHPDAHRVLVTGYAQHALHANTDDARLSAFIEKPLDAPTFMRLMRDLVNPPSVGGGAA